MIGSGRQAVLKFIILGLESCWLYALLTVLNGHTADGRLSVAGLLLLFPIAFIFNGLIGTGGRRKRFVTALSWIVWLVASLIILKIQLYSGDGFLDSDYLLGFPKGIAEFYNFEPELLMLISTAVFWWMGRRLTRLDVSFPVAAGEFQFGLGILIVVLFISYQVDIGIAGSYSVALAFFALAALGMFIAHAGERKGWLEVLQHRPWYGLLTVSIVIVIVLGLLFGIIVTDDFLDTLSTPFVWAWGLIDSAVDAITGLFGDSSGSDGTDDFGGGTMDPLEQQETRSRPMSESVKRVLAFVFIFFGIMCLVYAFYRMAASLYRWMRHMKSGRGGVEMETLQFSLRRELVRLFRWLVLGLFGIRKIFRFPGRRRAGEAELNAIRQTYRRLLRWAGDKGYPIKKAQTPQEYYLMLSALIPAAEQDLGYITEKYMITRYGSVVPTDVEIAEINRRWDKIRRNRFRKMTRGGY